MADRQPTPRPRADRTTPATAAPSTLADDLAVVLATVDRFVKGNGPAVSWLASRFGEYLGISQTQRAQPRSHRLLRTAAAFSLGELPRFGQSEARALLRAFFRHDTARLALVDALIAAPLVATCCRLTADSTGAELELVGWPREGRVRPVAQALWLGDDGAIEALGEAPVTRWSAAGAGEAEVVGWLVEGVAGGLFVAAAPVSHVGLARVRTAASGRLLSEAPDAATTRRFWQGMLGPQLVAALEPQPGRPVLAGRQAVLEQPSWHVRAALRRWLVVGLERLPLDAHLPVFIRPSQLSALPRLRSLRWMLAEVLEPAAVLDDLEPLFVALRFGLLPPAARDLATGPRDVRLDGWMTLEELLGAHGFSAPDGAVAGCGEHEVQAAPLRALGLPGEAAVWHELPDTARIQAALRWAEARPGHAETPGLGDAFRQYRAERRWLASWGARGPRYEQSEVYGELLYAALTRFPARVAATPLADLALDGGVRGRLERALGRCDTTLAELPERLEALLALSGVGPSTVTALLASVFEHLSRWREGENGQSRPPASQAAGSGPVSVALGDGLDELAALAELLT